MADPARIKRGIYGFAALIVLMAAGMRFAGVDRTLVGIVAGSGGLLVVLLLITYRAFAGVAAAARQAATEAPPQAGVQPRDREE